MRGGVGINRRGQDFFSHKVGGSCEENIGYFEFYDKYLVLAAKS